MGKKATDSALKTKAPFRVLFSNDFTNIQSCVSPYHQKGQQWTPQMLEATVDETAGMGVEVHMLQPCSTWVPWWKSEVYSMQEHYKWWKEKFGVDIPKMGVHEYIINGGDPFEDFINRCRKHKIAPFISVRLNDGHHLEHVDTPRNTKGHHTICKFYAEHPEYRIGADLKSWDQHVQNWAIPQVREYKFSLIKEICENYDIDGLELDFMRHTSYFQLDKTTKEQRAEIMTGFVSRVRTVLDETSKNGKHRWLCVRVPAYLSVNDKLGVNLPDMVTAGVDMINASAFFFTEQQSDIGKIIKSVPDTPVYLEMCHTTMTGKKVAKGYDVFTYRRVTDKQYYTTAHLAYSQGAAGVSAFNFVYYREHGSGEGRGPFNEPPFHVFKKLGDPKWLAKQRNQHYFLARGYGGRVEPANYLPKKFEAGHKEMFRLYMAPPTGGWQKDAKLRIQSEMDLAGSSWTAEINGIQLRKTEDLSEPYPNPYPHLLGTEETLRGWVVPKALLKDGFNEIEIAIVKGKTAKIIFLDLAAK
jgi:hypothetical protein